MGCRPGFWWLGSHFSGFPVEVTHPAGARVGYPGYDYEPRPEHPARAGGRARIGIPSAVPTLRLAQRAFLPEARPAHLGTGDIFPYCLSLPQLRSPVLPVLPSLNRSTTYHPSRCCKAVRALNRTGIHPHLLFVVTH